MAEHSSMNYVAPIVVGIAGMVRLIKSFLPEFIKTFKDKYLLEKRYALIYFSNLAYSIRRSVLLFSLIAGSVTGMVVIIATYYNSPREYITAIIGYIVIVVLLITSIVYKYCMEAQTRANLFYNLWKIGYTRSELIKIVNREVFYFYLLLLVVPMIYIVIIIGRFIYYGQMTMMFSCVLVLIYVISVIISGFLTRYNYRKLVIKGGK